MALTDAQALEIARKLARKIFVEARTTATANLDDLKSAVLTLDTAMSATGNQIATNYPTTQLKLALLQEIQTVAPNLSAQEAGISLAYWSLREVGLL